METNLNGEGYFNLLINEVMPSINKAIHLDPLLRKGVVFQECGAPPHCVVPCDSFSIITFRVDGI